MIDSSTGAQKLPEESPHVRSGNRLSDEEREIARGGVTPLTLDPDRLFPGEPATREIARDLYASVSELPIISPHSHVDPSLLLDNAPFSDPADLLIVHDHYVTRLLHAGGVDLDALGAGKSAPTDPRRVWQTLAENWHLFAGTATGYWLSHQLASLFAIDVEPSTVTADRLYDAISSQLDTAGFLPRALFDRFQIDVLATTDDPMDDLSAHAALAADPSFRGRIIPTFRPDAYLDPADPTFVEGAHRLAAWAGEAAGDYAGYLRALEGRRRYFIEHGAVSADHGVVEPFTIELDDAAASALYQRALAGKLTAEESRVFRGHMLFQMARMSVADGLVMTVHPGVHRNHSTATYERFGADTGHDIPIATGYTRNLHPLLEKYGLERDFHLVLFSVDETAYSREIAPLAGFYPSVYIGAPWWFLDAPDSILRFRAAVTETAGFYRGSGFIDDTRAFLSIPARHDMARRLDAAFLARLVREGRLSPARAETIIVDLVDVLPRKVFKL
ncbi:MAG: glucuronate isomerase [Cryobacterium sp.]|nr:glucuronate isomerase [Cryobacterium sp.]